jgi:hypothetical protein
MAKRRYKRTYRRRYRRYYRKRRVNRYKYIDVKIDYDDHLEFVANGNIKFSYADDYYFALDRIWDQFIFVNNYTEMFAYVKVRGVKVTYTPCPTNYYYVNNTGVVIAGYINNPDQNDMPAFNTAAENPKMIRLNPCKTTYQWINGVEPWKYYMNCKKFHDEDKGGFFYARSNTAAGAQPNLSPQWNVHYTMYVRFKGNLS